MREGWSTVALSEVARLDVERVTVVPGQAYKVAGVLNAGQGMLEREPIDGSDTNYSVLHRLRAGQLVMRKLTAWEGPITVVPAQFDGYVASPEFPTFTLNEGRLLPQYMRLVCQQPDFWDQMQDRSTGTVQRRKRVNPGQLLQVTIALPPLAEQRRIVDLMAAVDRVRLSASAVAAAAREAWETLIGDFEGQISNRVAAGDVLLAVEPGKSPAAEDRLPSPGESAVLKVSAVGRNQFVPEEVKTLPAGLVLPPETRLKSGDILMTRASGALHRVGQVCRVTEAPDRYFLCDKTLRLVPSAGVDPDWLTIALLAPAARRQIEATTTGSDMRNISQAAIRSVKIALPPMDIQQSLAAVAKALTAELEASRNVERAAVNARQALLGSLLSGVGEIGDSYDALLEPAL